MKSVRGRDRRGRGRAWQFTRSHASSTGSPPVSPIVEGVLIDEYDQILVDNSGSLVVVYT